MGRDGRHDDIGKAFVSPIETHFPFATRIDTAENDIFRVTFWGNPRNMPAVNLERKVRNEGLELRLNGQLLPSKFGPGGNLRVLFKHGDGDDSTWGIVSFERGVRAFLWWWCLRFAV